jgi:hypothetical protein
MAKFDISQFSKANPGVTAAMAMKKEKRPMKKSFAKDPNKQGLQDAAIRRLKKFKGQSGGSNSNK